MNSDYQRYRDLIKPVMLLLLIFLVLGGASPARSAAAAPYRSGSPEAGTSPGMNAPAFQMQDAGGTPRRVGGPREKAVILNFWASWCQPCRLEAPDLNQLAMKYNQVLDVYGINVASQDDKRSAEEFVKEFNLSFPVMYDTDGQVFAKYHGQVFPTNVLIDKNGIVTEVILGVLSPEELERKIRMLTAP